MERRAEAAGRAWVEILAFLAAMAFLLVMLLSLRAHFTHDPRLPCGTNLAGIGYAMLLYSNDYRDELPRAGGANSEWTGRVADWQARDRNAAYGLDANGTGGQASVSASLYLLVKYMEVTPKSFLCRGDREAREFKMEDYGFRGSKPALADLWDFGSDPAKHCSYAYQMQYGEPALTVSADAGMAIAADRNPWMDEERAGSFSRFKPAIEPFKGTTHQARGGNAIAHKGDGQNVMFLDTHVEFVEWSYCSVDDDNIYTSWDGTDKVRGNPPKLGSQPAGEKDSLLVNDPPAPRK
jgi:hypothetical protein